MRRSHSQEEEKDRQTDRNTNIKRINTTTTASFATIMQLNSKYVHGTAQNHKTLLGKTDLNCFLRLRLLALENVSTQVLFWLTQGALQQISSWMLSADLYRPNSQVSTPSKLNFSHRTQSSNNN